MEIHQFVPSLASGDATAYHVLQMRRVLRERFKSEIFYDNADRHMAGEGRHYWDYSSRRSALKEGALLLYHLGIGSPLAQHLFERPEQLLLYYHNITPANYFVPYDETHVDELSEGVRQLEQLASKTQLAWGASEYSVKELKDAGYARAQVLPLLIEWARYDRDPDLRTLSWLRDSKKAGPDVLFVGRVAPNKKHEDLVKLLHVFREMYGEEGRLFLAGPHHPHTDAYSRAIKRFAETMSLSNVRLLGSIEFDKLLAYYHGCDVFVSMSEHEGFGLPLVEAMYLGLPVIAYSSTAVSETLGYGGLLYSHKDLGLFAASVHRIQTDQTSRTALIDAGRRRAAEFALQKIEGALRGQLDEL